MIRKMLVALDASSRAEQVFAEAMALARATGAKVRLFRAIPIQPEIPWDMIPVFPPGGLEERLTQDAKANLDAHAAQVPPEVRDGVVTAIGKPWTAVCAAATDYGADVIVIGSHGYGVADRVLGTTAAKIVNHAGCAVYVVRCSDAGEPPPHSR